MKLLNTSNDCYPKYPTIDTENARDPGMQLNLSKSTKQPNQWFAGALFVFSLLGSITPHHTSHTKGHYHANILYSHQIQKSDDDFWYTPPRSPAFNDLLGS
jgi:hypothetical protein